MRFLKNKILRAHESIQNHSSNPATNPNETFAICQHLTHHNSSILDISTKPAQTSSNTMNTVLGNKEPKTRSSRHQRVPSSDPKRATKNIVINYGKAMASFAVSSLAISYLQRFLEQETVELTEFITFVSHSRDNIGGIAGLRRLLLTGGEDDSKTRANKKMFRAISEVFIKYFSVNWIINGKVTHKLVYLKYRSKMLRRVQNPELFTYVKDFVKRKGT